MVVKRADRRLFLKDSATLPPSGLLLLGRLSKKKLKKKNFAIARVFSSLGSVSTTGWLAAWLAASLTLAVMLPADLHDTGHHHAALAG